jgi:hypothetical protein
MSGLPPQLAGTGGVRSPAGPYGPPGFIDGAPAPLRTGGGASGVGTTMYPQTGGLDPGVANQGALNGPRLPPIPPEFAGAGNAQAWANLYGANKPLLPNDPSWFSSPQGLQQGVDLTQRMTRGYGPGTLGTGGMGGNHLMRGDPRTNAGEGGQSPKMTRQQAAAQVTANWQNPDWRMQQVLGGKIAPTNNAELQAMLANMSPADRDAYIAKYKSIGLDPTYQGGGGSGPFGN